MFGNTIRRIQTLIIKKCNPKGQTNNGNTITECYECKADVITDEKVVTNYEIDYDNDTTPKQIRNVRTGQTWTR